VATHSLLAAACLIGLAACATSRGPYEGELYAMPGDLDAAMAPEEADPTRAAELAESALYLLDPERAGGPDYLGAARMCLLATEVAEPRIEEDLVAACFRLAARSALRSGDRELYIEAVNAWEDSAPRSQRRVGELAVHRSIRDRLSGGRPRFDRRLPPELRRLIPPAEDEA
jgi:hypothetical protein